MTTLGHESRMMQNSALGAVLLWRFAAAYTKSSGKEEVLMPLCFLPLPMVWHEKTAEHVRSTQLNSGLRRFAAKFTDETPSDLDILLDLNRRAYLWRSKSLQSLRFGVSTGLMKLNKSGHIKPNEKDWSVNECNPQTRKMCNAAGKIGAWFAPLSLREISMAIHVNF
jgi:hypothetical protein